MARTELERTVLPSLLERLTDGDPRVPAEPPVTREESVRRYRLSVLRDVEWLLNSRQTPERAPDGLGEVGRSVFHYGLRDTTALAANTPDGQDALVRWVEEAIAAFEPRLVDVRVALGDVDQAQAPQVRFVVAALLRMDPSPEQVVFDTVYDLASGGYAVVAPGAAGGTPAGAAPTGAA